MTIDAEMLMAYADGALDPLQAKRVERAMADDPAVAAEVERHRALNAMLRGTFDPIAAAAAPAAAVHTIEAATRVTPLAPRITPPANARRERAFWMGAVAASLVAGVVAGPLVLAPPTGQQIAFEDNRLIARGALDRALNTQLASTQPTDAPVRIGVSFYDDERRLCRTFEGVGLSGIACADGRAWQLERLYGGNGRLGGDYRKASSAASLALRDAQEMMAGSPLDAAGEATALAAARTK